MPSDRYLRLHERYEWHSCHRHSNARIEIIVRAPRDKNSGYRLCRPLPTMSCVRHLRCRINNRPRCPVTASSASGSPFSLLPSPFSIASLHRVCTLLAMGAQWMLKGCSMVAETILSTLSLIYQPSDHYPSVFLRLYRSACFQRLTHLVPHVVAQPPLNRLITPSRLAFGLIILGLPRRTTLRIIKNSFAGSYIIRKTLACRMSSFLLLRLFA